MLPPFNFPKPIMYAVEGTDIGEGNYEMIGLWKLPVLGQGKGESIIPISPEAHTKSIVACSQDAVEKLKGVGYEDFTCHSPEYCTAR